MWCSLTQQYLLRTSCELEFPFPFTYIVCVNILPVCVHVHTVGVVDGLWYQESNLGSLKNTYSKLLASHLEFF